MQTTGQLLKLKLPNLYYYIWIQHEKCIQMSTNKPIIDSLVLEIAPWICKEYLQMLSFLYSKLWPCSMHNIKRRSLQSSMSVVQAIPMVWSCLTLQLILLQILSDKLNLYCQWHGHHQSLNGLHQGWWTCYQVLCVKLMDSKIKLWSNRQLPSSEIFFLGKWDILF